MFLFYVFHIINILYLIVCKNIVLPFKKITVETFKEYKTINDLISYNIFTNIELGSESEPQFVGFIIDQNESSFYLKKRLLSFNFTKSNEIMKLYHKMPNFWFDKRKSKEIVNCDYAQYCSDTFFFNNLENEKTKIHYFRYNIYCDFIIESYKCGIIGMKNPNNLYYENNQTYIYFLDELKQKELIDENYFTILYDDNNNNFDYNENLYLGKLIIGESPHIFNPLIFKKRDEVIIPGIDYSFFVNELKFNSSNEFYIENNVEILISFTSGFIKGSPQYRKEIESNFFKDLIKKDLCKVDFLSENLYISNYYIYSCLNNDTIIDYIKNFPPLFLEIKTQNLTFILSEKDLFRVFQDRIYFLIAFRDEKPSTFSSKWIVGEIFLRKYITSFNFDSKSISFYRSQIDKANNNNQIIYDEDEIEKKSNIFNIFRTLLEILMGLFIILMLFIFYRKIKGRRKLHANELEDNNFSYVPKKESKLILLDKDGN